jgi:pantetheine-phosphate adenylyltransferase
MVIKAIYPGTFDPITNGHIDLVERASRMFDQLLVAIAASPTKKPLFSLEERLDMTRQTLAHIDDLTVIGFEGLLIDCAAKYNAQVVLRGLRAVSDFEYEFQLAAMNQRLDPEIDTVFLTPAENYTFLSASLVKEIAALGGDVSQFLDPKVNAALKAKLA